jgi:hypothetical protein
MKTKRKHQDDVYTEKHQDDLNMGTKKICTKKKHHHGRARGHGGRYNRFVASLSPSLLHLFLSLFPSLLPFAPEAVASSAGYSDTL